MSPGRLQASPHDGQLDLAPGMRKAPATGPGPVLGAVVYRLSPIVASPTANYNRVVHHTPRSRRFLHRSETVRPSAGGSPHTAQHCGGHEQNFGGAGNASCASASQRTPCLRKNRQHQKQSVGFPSSPSPWVAVLSSQQAHHPVTLRGLRRSTACSSWRTVVISRPPIRSRSR